MADYPGLHRLRLLQKRCRALSNHVTKAADAYFRERTSIKGSMGERKRTDEYAWGEKAWQDGRVMILYITGKPRRSSRRLRFLVQLPGVYDIVPDAVEAAYYRGYGVEEDKAHPDGEDGVLLSHRLTGGDG